MQHCVHITFCFKKPTFSRPTHCCHIYLVSFLNFEIGMSKAAPKVNNLFQIKIPLQRNVSTSGAACLDQTY